MELSMSTSTSTSTSTMSVTYSQASSMSASSDCNNENGQRELDWRYRSVLCHRLSLPLVCIFHGQDPGKLKYLGKKSGFFSSTTDCNNKTNSYADVLQEAVTTWSTDENLAENEVQLTTILQDTINGNREIPLKAKGEEELDEPDQSVGWVDIVLYNDDESTGSPLMLMEVGFGGVDWWKKFDQGVQYIKTNNRTSKQPLLLAIMTVDDERRIKEPNPRFVVKLGVFLCFWKNEDEDSDDVRISFLWQSKTPNLHDGSESFGRLLRGVCDFSSWRANIHVGQNESHYEYFSPNCCRLGDQVLRIYDNRFRASTRSPEIYLSPTCADIVGEGAEVSLNLHSDPEYSYNDDSDEFSNVSSKRLLQVIAIPFRPGRHYATKPKSFVPVICQLEKLHQKGFVHGDIRGFNTVFDEENDQGYLIDFDFGGKPGREYPKGYKTELADGYRLIDNKTNPSKNMILPWHDWYALGRLIFLVHDFVLPNGTPATEKAQLFDFNSTWASLCQAPTNEMISELKQFLIKIQMAGCTVKPGGQYQAELDRVGRSGTRRSDETR